MRHLINPFTPGRDLLSLACPMGDVMKYLGEQLAELQSIKTRQGNVTEME